MHLNWRFSSVFSVALLLFLAGNFTAQAQVVPDSTQQQKQELPTGPPMPVEQPRPPQRQPEPRPVPQPETPETSGRLEEQEKVDMPLRHIDRMYVGGSFGLQFGTYTNISLLPIIGYKVTDKFSIGTGFVYHYIKYLGSAYSSYGGRVFTQLELFSIGDGAVLGHAEVEFLNTKFENQRGTIGNDRTTLTLPLVGLGYRQFISDKASVDMLLLYNANSEVIGNPYSNPVIRVGFNIPLTSR
ncbi:hypothetical protein MKJ04_15300 [Pontibacter sp. E15-1]|uniref:hypothetical protein n=1 Tax=Pontibacter sp. E15-1 TaxID=2919918 RepID=UPI001F4F2401|nr:hypothetical protein [Pontibacter sp. E15-1]MCJ8166213.1 hypothetical protein [Pontibacter sp. E15-1]